MLIALIATALCIGQFIGLSNKRCYSKESDMQQGRLRLDDCSDIECHKKGCCKYEPSSRSKV